MIPNKFLMFLCQKCLAHVDSLLFHECKSKISYANDPHGFDDGARDFEDDASDENWHDDNVPK